MLPDKFFEEYAKTYDHPVTEDPEPEKEKTYTAAEVEEIVNDKLEKALQGLTAKEQPVEPGNVEEVSTNE